MNNHNLSVKQLSKLLDSHEDSERELYFWIKEQLQQGLNVTFFSSLPMRELNQMDEESLVHILLETVFARSEINRCRYSPEELVFNRVEAYTWFLGDKVRVEGSGIDPCLASISETTFSAKVLYQDSFTLDKYCEDLHAYPITIKLVEDGQYRKQFEKVYTDVDLKLQTILPHLKNELRKSLGIRYQTHDLIQETDLTAVVDLICHNFGWDLNQEPVAVNNNLWDFDLRDFALIKILTKQLQGRNIVSIGDLAQGWQTMRDCLLRQWREEEMLIKSKFKRDQ